MKLFWGRWIGLGLSGSRATSTRTRIETEMIMWVYATFGMFKSDIHENKD